MPGHNGNPGIPGAKGDQGHKGPQVRVTSSQNLAFSYKIFIRHFCTRVQLNISPSVGVGNEFLITGTWGIIF